MIEGPAPRAPRDTFGKRKRGGFAARQQMSKLQPTTAGDIKALIDNEIRAYPVETRAGRMTVDAFRTQLREPRQVTVNFSGGITQTCWSVTRGDGCYRVIYMPTAGYFSLCVESDFGPLDIGVHGKAIDCFGSV